MIVIIIVLHFIIIKSEIWIINHGLDLGPETMVCAICIDVQMMLPF